MTKNVIYRDVIVSTGSMRKAAKHLGLSFSAFKHRYRKQEGLCPRCGGEINLEGYNLCSKCNEEFKDRRRDPNVPANEMVDSLKPCLCCEKIFKVKRQWQKRREFCSNSCRSRFHNSGKRSGHYRDGASLRKYKFAFYKMREKVLKRDNETCQLCNKKKITLEVHHIDYDKDNNHPDNLITSCRRCHAKTGSKDKTFWVELFNSCRTIQERAFKYYREKRGFPFPDYSKEKIQEDHMKLCEEGRGGNAVLNQHVKSKLKVHKPRSVSYYDTFHDDSFLNKTLESILENGKTITDSSVRLNLKVNYRASGISFFPNSYAKMICDKYGGERVYDPCAGWGNRLVSCVASGKEYWGQDTNEELVQELLSVIRVLKCREFVNLYCRDSSKYSPADESFDLAFTCPPYYDLEIYPQADYGSSYEDWRDRILYGIYQGMIDSVKVRGYCAVAIKNLKKYALLDDTKKFFSRLEFVEEIAIDHQIGYMKGKSMDLDTIVVYKKK